MVKELNYSNVEREDVSIFTDGIVLRKYNEINNGYDFKILANVAVVNDSNGLRVYGESEGEEELYCNINEIVGFTEKTIEIVLVDENYRLPEGEMIISPYVNENEGVFDKYALVLYNGAPTLYLNYEKFDESALKDIYSVLTRLYLL